MGSSQSSAENENSTSISTAGPCVAFCSLFSDGEQTEDTDVRRPKKKKKKKTTSTNEYAGVSRQAVNETFIAEFSEMMSTGGIRIKKHGRTGKAATRMLRLEPDGNTLTWDTQKIITSDSSIKIDEITAITRGAFPDTTLSEKQAKCCLSLHTASRRLDIETYSAVEADVLADGFDLLMNRPAPESANGAAPDQNGVHNAATNGAPAGPANSNGGGAPATPMGQNGHA